MTYDTRERSADTGRPVELYAFARGPMVWRYTSADRDLVVETQTYAPAVIRRGNIEQGPEVSRAMLKLTVPRNLDVLDLYRIVPPSDDITLTLRQYHAGDSEIATLWQGVVVAVTFTGAEATIQLEPQASGLRRTGLRRIYQKQCPFALYGPDCKLNPAAHRTTGTVAAISGLTLTVLAAAGHPNGYFEGGYLEWLLVPGVYERRFILAHTTSSLDLDAPPVGIEAGAEVRCYPGCDHAIVTCDSKFANAVNYGGMPYIPLKNPFGSDPVY